MRYRAACLRPRSPLWTLLAVLLLCLAGPVRPVYAALVSWVGPAEGDWTDPGNWSTGTLPGSGDDVVVDIGVAVLVHYSNGSAQVRSLSLRGTLELSAGSLTLTHASQIDGVLTIDADAALTAAGPLASLTVTGQTDVTGGVFAVDGAQVSLPGVTQRAGGGLFRAEGPGSRIVLDGLDSVGVPPAGVPHLTDAVSRQATVYRGALDSPDPRADLRDAVSRQASVNREGAAP